MLIACPDCRAKVDAKDLKEISCDSENGWWRYTFLQCPSCDLPMLAEQEGSPDHDKMHWDPPLRVWPETPSWECAPKTGQISSKIENRPIGAFQVHELLELDRRTIAD